MALAVLLKNGGQAASACRRALLMGGEFRVWEDDGVSVAGLAAIYRGRERRTRAKGTVSVGFADAVAQLEACEFDRVLLGYVRGGEPRYHFQIFLSPDAARLVACLGVGLGRQC